MTSIYHNFSSTIINSEFKNYGINYDINKKINLENFTLATYNTDGITFNINDIHYNIKEFIDIASGSYNKIKKGIIKINDVDTTVAIRLSSNYVNYRTLIYYMIENLKHIILYILLTIRGIKTKILPKPYFLTYATTIHNGITFYRPIFIMEYYEYTLYHIINQIKNKKHISTNIEKIKNIYYAMHLGLEKIRDSGILFRHGDLKENNIMINKEDKTVMIDFGLSIISFMVHDKIINLKSYLPEILLYKNPNINIYHDMFFLRFNITKYKIKLFKHVTKTLYNRKLYKRFIYFLEKYDDDVFRFIYDINIIKMMDKFYRKKIITKTKFRDLDYKKIIDDTVLIDSNTIKDILDVNVIESEIFDDIDKKYLKYLKITKS